MARSGRWTVAQLNAAIGGVLAGASYKTVERLRERPTDQARKPKRLHVEEARSRLVDESISHR